MALSSTYMKYSYPDEYANPFWDDFEALVRQVDKASFMSKLKSNLLIGDGGTVSFNSTSGIISWTGDFVIPMPHFGFKLTVSYGPDGISKQMGLLDGSAIVVDLPFAMSQNETRTFQVSSQLNQSSNSLWVAGVRIGDKVYFKGLSPVG